MSLSECCDRKACASHNTVRKFSLRSPLPQYAFVSYLRSPCLQCLQQQLWKSEGGRERGRPGGSGNTCRLRSRFGLAPSINVVACGLASFSDAIAPNDGSRVSAEGNHYSFRSQPRMRPLLRVGSTFIAQLLQL